MWLLLPTSGTVLFQRTRMAALTQRRRRRHYWDSLLEPRVMRCVVSISLCVCAGTASYSPPVLCILCTKRLLCYVFVACFCFIRLAMSIAPPHYLLPLGLFFGECGVESSCIPYRVDRPTSRCGPAECEMSIVWDCSAGVKGQMEALCEVAGVCIKFCISWPPTAALKLQWLIQCIYISYTVTNTSSNWCEEHLKVACPFYTINIEWCVFLAEYLLACVCLLCIAVPPRINLFNSESDDSKDDLPLR